MQDVQSPVEVPVTRLGGLYMTGTVGGHSASSRASASHALMRLAAKLWPNGSYTTQELTTRCPVPGVSLWRLYGVPA